MRTVFTCKCVGNNKSCLQMSIKTRGLLIGLVLVRFKWIINWERIQRNFKLEEVFELLFMKQTNSNNSKRFQEFGRIDQDFLIN